MTTNKHFTTRRSFVVAAGFGGVSLYGLWAAYGAAPGPLELLGLSRESGAAHAPAHGEDAAPPMAKPVEAGAHGGHGAAMARGPSAEEFARLSAEFSERYRLPDGSVYPRQLPATPFSAVDPHAGHNMAAMAMAPSAEPAAHGGRLAEPALRSTPGANRGEPMDVLMTAGKWYYQPNVLRLDVGQVYRFRMMALDQAHGASIQFGQGARMMRLQPGRLTETELRFDRAGRYFVYCTVYCGEAHDMMQATIEVV